LNRVLASSLKPEKREDEERERTVVRDTAFITGHFIQSHGLEYCLAVPSLTTCKCTNVGDKLMKPSEVKKVRRWEVDWCPKATGRQFVF
jgi:hypothetical protein